MRLIPPGEVTRERLGAHAEVRDEFVGAGRRGQYLLLEVLDGLVEGKPIFRQAVHFAVKLQREMNQVRWQQQEKPKREKRCKNLESRVDERAEASPNYNEAGQSSGDLVSVRPGLGR